MSKLLIQYELGNHGWAEVVFTIEGVEHRFTVSYLHDSLLDLASLARAISEGEARSARAVLWTNRANYNSTQ